MEAQKNVRCIVIILILNFALFFCPSEALSCPGFCTTDLGNCTGSNGKIVGYCVNGMACCSIIAGITGSCGSNFKHLSTTYFKSPHFPKNSSGELNCEYKLKLDEKSIGIRIDFLHFQSDDLGFAQAKSCDSDHFYIRGFQTWVPTSRCGNLTGYSTIIDKRDDEVKELKTLILLALMSSPTYSWHIRITQLYTKTPNVKELISFPGRMEGKNSLNLQLEEFHNESEDTDVWDTKKLNVSISSIVNGVDTLITTVPWQASLRLFHSNETYSTETIQAVIGENCSITEGYHFCGGSIIGERHILTAAHCFLGSSKVEGMTVITQVKVVLGDTDKCKDDDKMEYNSSQYDISRVIFHYAFDINTVNNDLAILELQQPIEFKENIKLLRLSDKTTNVWTIGSTLLASGWGMTDLGEDAGLEASPRILQSTDQFILQNETLCHQLMEENIGAPPENVKGYTKYQHVYDGVFCTQSVNSSAKVYTGAGDSGGSLVYWDETIQKYIQLGIVSYALTNKSLDSNQTSVKQLASPENVTECTISNVREGQEVDFFQSVPYYREWIDLAMSSA